MQRDLSRLKLTDADPRMVNVMIETPKGYRNKYKYDESLGLFTLSKVLPLGLVFPYDFGFLPSTRGEDGDPLDILVLMDEPAFPGCLVTSRLIGVIEAEQTERDGTSERNDRMIAVAERSRVYGEIETLSGLNEAIVREIEAFFVTYNAITGKQFRPVGRFGPERATALIAKAAL